MRQVQSVAAAALLLLALPLGARGVAALQATTPVPAASLESRRQALRALLAEHWEYTLRTNPVFASMLGDRRYNDRLDDNSLAAIEADLEQKRQFLSRFQALDTTGFPEQEALDQELMAYNLRREIERARFRHWEMPVNQVSGIQIQMPQMAQVLPFETEKDYLDYAARLKQLPRAFDDTLEHMRAGMRDHLMPPRFLLEKVVEQTHGIAAAPPEQSPFVLPATRKLSAAFSPELKQRVTVAMVDAVRQSVIPAYVKLEQFLKTEYVAQGRTEVGIWSLPDGAERYARNVADMTTTSLTPDQIHELGLQQVAEIEKGMLEIARRLGHPDLESLRRAVRSDPRLRFQSRDEILERYRRHIDAMTPQLPKLFGRLPKAGMEVIAVEAFREKQAPDAQYLQGTRDGKRPGYVQVNTSDPQTRSMLEVEATAYHEGVPGHHMQIAIQQELDVLPPFRQQAHYGAFVEGWALYAERLGKELGFYEDPYSDYGRLQSEMLRAIRLVVDSGLHHKRWTREQVVQFFHGHSTIDEVSVQNETDRYISWPGQALGYKVGQLKILELRERAHKALGPRFDLRAFHDEVLGAGALPLDVLERRIDRWIDARAPSQPASPGA
jgi:uncharacterized protein (DUF885 family)